MKKRTIWKKILMTAALVALVISGVTLPEPETGRAVTEISKLQAELNKLRQQKAQAQKAMKEAENTIKALNQQKKRTQEELNALMDRIGELSMQITEKEAGIDQKERELDAAEQQLQEAIDRVEARDQLLRSRIKLAYMKGNVTYLEVLMKSTSFSDFLNRFKALRSLVGQDKELLEQNRRDKERIEATVASIESMLASLIQEYNEMEEMKRELVAQQKEKEVMIAQFTQEMEEHEHVTEEQEKLLLQIASQENKLIKELQQLELKYKGSGKLGYPLPKVYPVTSGYGSRVDPITGKKGAFHAGIDIGAPGGTDILAAEDGIVIQAGMYGGYGNTVIINHGVDSSGKELWTLYAHASKVLVKKGDSVKKGDVIAKVGTTGRSTGNHLHFGVYLNEEAVDPKKYVNF